MDCPASPSCLLLLFCTALTFGQYKPLTLELADKPGNSVATAIIPEEHGVIAAAFEAAGLSGLLNGAEAITVFLPSDTSVIQWSGKPFSELMRPENRKELRSLLTYHLVAGRLTAARILRAMCRGAGTTVFTTLQGNEILASMQGTDILLTDCAGQTARITAADIYEGNGVIHQISRVLLPR